VLNYYLCELDGVGWLPTKMLTDLLYNRYDDPEDMWSFFGNGFHVCERDGSDITWYLGNPEKKVDEVEVRETMSGMKGIPLLRAPVD
jgi:hypothetical protein